MNGEKKSWELVLEALKERAKELNCLYSVEEILSKNNISLPEALQKIVNAIPPGWQYPDVCEAIIEYQGDIYRTSEFAETGCGPANDRASAPPEKTQVSSPKTGSDVKRKQHKKNTAMRP